MKTLIYTFITLVASLFLCCADNSVSTKPTVNQFPEPIWYTDSLGNYLGGDSSNFCIDNLNQCGLKPVYPNPVNNRFTLKFVTIGNALYPDTISIYFLNSTADTNYVVKNKPYTNSINYINLNADSLGYSNQIVRLYFKNRRVCNIIYPNHCSYSGNVKFN